MAGEGYGLDTAALGLSPSCSSTGSLAGTVSEGAKMHRDVTPIRMNGRWIAGLWEEDSGLTGSRRPG